MGDAAAPPVIAYDIEIAGPMWEEVDPCTRSYLLERARNDEERAAVPERTGLFPGLGKIVAIGLWNLDMDRGLCLLEGEACDPGPWAAVPAAEIARGSEAEILERFWEVVARKRPRLVSFNGRSFDGPLLMIRSAQLGVRPCTNLVGNRFVIGDHCDLLELFTFMGAVRERYSLDYWCRRFGVESPKGGLDGSQVSGAYREGRLEEIGAYCLADARATAGLYRKLQDTLVPLFRF